MSILRSFIILFLYNQPPKELLDALMSTREEVTDVLPSRPQQLSLFQGTKLSEGLPMAHDRGRIPPPHRLNIRTLILWRGRKWASSVWRPNTEYGSVKNIQTTALVRTWRTLSYQGLGFASDCVWAKSSMKEQNDLSKQGPGRPPQRLAERQLTHGHLMASLCRFQRAWHGAICGRRQERHCESFPLTDLLLRSVPTSLSVSSLKKKKQKKQNGPGRCIFLNVSKQKTKSSNLKCWNWKEVSRHGNSVRTQVRKEASYQPSWYQQLPLFKSN